MGDLLLHNFTLVLVLEAERLVLNNLGLHLFLRFTAWLLLLLFASHYF
jgi:hypothetical protein